MSAQWSPTPFCCTIPKSSASTCRGLKALCEVGLTAFGTSNCFSSVGEAFGDALQNQDIHELAEVVLVGVAGPDEATVEVSLPEDDGRSSESAGIILNADGNMLAPVFAGTSLFGLGDREGVTGILGTDRDLLCENTCSGSYMTLAAREMVFSGSD